MKISTIIKAVVLFLFITMICALLYPNLKQVSTSLVNNLEDPVQRGFAKIFDKFLDFSHNLWFSILKAAGLVQGINPTFKVMNFEENTCYCYCY